MLESIFPHPATTTVFVVLIMLKAVYSWFWLYWIKHGLECVQLNMQTFCVPLGLVFLVYGDQTKKSMLPNEITTLDTVRALFVRAFPDLTLEMLEDPRKKIYLLDPATNIYFQLEDLMYGIMQSCMLFIIALVYHNRPYQLSIGIFRS